MLRPHSPPLDYKTGRAGPLIEIVTQPDIRSAEEAQTFLESHAKTSCAATSRFPTVKCRKVHSNVMPISPCGLRGAPRLVPKMEIKNRNLLPGGAAGFE